MGIDSEHRGRNRNDFVSCNEKDDEANGEENTGTATRRESNA
jgi:hypothetical protein